MMKGMVFGMISYIMKYKKAFAFCQLFFIYSWITNLAKTDSYFSVYMLCALGGLICICDNYRRKPAVSRRNVFWIAAFAALFALATVLANYTLFEPITALLSMFNAGCSFLGGFAVGFNVLLCLLTRLPLACDASERTHPVRLFLFVFVSIAVIDLLYLYFASYPGVLTTDSVSTIEQIACGQYDNVMPYWHTVTVELFYRIGFAFFGEINGAIAFFHSVQILFLAACFGYALVTLYQAGVPRGVIGICYGIYALLPYNIAYSATLWKDVPFAAAALLFVTGLYRILRKVGKSQMLNYVVFTLGAVGFSLWRTNGWYAFLATTLVMLLLLRKHYKKLLVIMCAVLVFCWVLINPVLDVLGVSGTDFMEALAVPFQQITRVVANDRELTEDEEALLSEAFWLNRMKELYNPKTVDPIKFETFRHDNREYVEAHLGDYVKLYLKLGLRYPGDYLKAWIEETKGYWNGGYSFWIYTKGVDSNDLGITWTGGDNGISRAFAALFRYLEKPAILQPLYSIGLQVWIVIACCLINVLKKREEFLLTIPLLVLIIGLWLGSPVYAEFRYAYPVFLTVPVILCGTLFHDGEKVSRLNQNKPV